MLSVVGSIDGGGTAESRGADSVGPGVEGTVLATEPFDFRPDGRDVFFLDPFLTKCSMVTSSTICQYPPLPSSSSGCRSVIADLGFTLNAHLEHRQPGIMVPYPTV